MMLKNKEIKEELKRGFANNEYIPEEVISEILSRVPPKPLTQFKTTSKQWLSLISNPLFIQSYLNKNATTSSGIFVYAIDHQKNKQYILTASPDGGTLTHLHTFNHGYAALFTTKTEHINGLVLLSCNLFAYVVNPTTRQFFNLPYPTFNVYRYSTIYRYNFFGFDQSQNQHKVLHMRVLGSVSIPVIPEFYIFSLSDYSWRKLHKVAFPVDDHNVARVIDSLKRGICVNSVIHIMHPFRYNKILTFDLTTECFSVINLPQDYTYDQVIYFKTPFLIQINGGLLGLVYHNPNQIDVWILQDYENRVWVRKTITNLSDDKSWVADVLDFLSEDNKFVFSPKKEKNATISVPIYDLKIARLESLNFLFDDHPFLCSKSVRFLQFTSYVGTISPLKIQPYKGLLG